MDSSATQAPVLPDRVERPQLIAHADRMSALGAMAAGVVHEINNPLAWVLGSLDLMAESLQSLPRGAREELEILVRDAHQGAQRVAEIVHGLKAFSRQSDENGSPVSLVESLEEALRITQNQIRHRAQLERSIETVPLVMGDANDLVQAFACVLSNAARAIPVGGANSHCVRVSLRQGPGNQAVVEIVDDGTGMTPDVVRQALEPFYKSEGHGGGPGLGLSICNRIVTNHGGSIRIESDLGIGTTVRLTFPTLPAVAESPLEVPVQQVESVPGEAHSVMIIDDEQPIRSLAARALRALDVVEFADGRAALNFLEEGFAPSVIICDLMMPEMSGRDVYEAIHERWPHLAPRVVFLTGGIFVQELSEWINALDNLVVEKPFGIRELRELVAERVEHAA